ncbi:hypothetical protein KIL84_001796 [Mauremys mutica]|uniref:Uncharacterized protein n=1 Tax=Mauremys mutica TaxID=74926 RepID=A0A9D3XJ17_9SAUR|nr:hypothetical protein KIL84_001796 [Mauremys mutica]
MQIRFNEPELRKAPLTTHDCDQQREQNPQSCSHIRRSVLQLCLTRVVENLEWGARPLWQSVTDVVQFDREVFVIDVRTVPMRQRPVKVRTMAQPCFPVCRPLTKVVQPSPGLFMVLLSLV